MSILDQLIFFLSFTEIVKYHFVKYSSQFLAYKLGFEPSTFEFMVALGTTRPRCL